MQKYIASIIAILFFLTGCDADNSFSITKKGQFDFNPEQVKSIKIDSAVSKISIIQDENAEKVQVIIKDKGTISDDCDVSVTLENNVLKIKNKRKKSAEKLLICSLDFKIIVPNRIVTTDINLGSGKIKIKNLSTNLKINAGSGDLEINAPLESLKVDSGSMDATIQGLLGSANFSFGSGKLLLNYDNTKHPLSLDLNGGSLDCIISVPENMGVSYKLSNASQGLEVIDNLYKNNHKNIGLVAHINAGYGKIKFING
jgi:hypothetical protein